MSQSRELNLGRFDLVPCDEGLHRHRLARDSSVNKKLVHFELVTIERGKMEDGAMGRWGGLESVRGAKFRVGE